MNRSSLRASALPEPGSGGNTTPDDEVLQSELRAKVNELYGGRQNVRINVESDSPTVELVGRANRFNRKNAIETNGTVKPVAEWFRSTRYIITFIVVVSLITGSFFTALYYSGAVHGFDSSDGGQYEMPTYGKSSYIDPYELLDSEARALQDRGSIQQPQS